MPDENENQESNYISSITLPDGTTYQIKDTNAVLAHKLTFGAGGTYVFDGSTDVTVPVYTGTAI